MPDTSQRPAATARRAALTTAMDGQVAVLSMGLAPYNLMDRGLNRELISGLEWAQREGARAVVLRSALRHFSAGADLDAMSADADQADVLDWGFVATLRAFDEHPAPVIASIQGVCVGGGFELALACDLMHCARTLLDLGAEVIKVEPPGGDLSRKAFPRRGEISGYYCQQNAGKRNVSIDLNVPGAREVAVRLCDACDVIVENFRPGALGAFGLDYQSVSARNPAVVYASISGYGQHGRWRSRMAYAPTIQAETGITANTADHFGHPDQLRSDSLSHADVYSGLHAAIAILACLTERERTGQGQYVDVAMAAVMLSVNERVHADGVRDFAATDWAREWNAVRTVSDRADGTIRIPGRPWHFGDQPAADDDQLAAGQGEHNAEVLAELGFTTAEIKALECSGALVQPGRDRAPEAEPGVDLQP